MPIIRNPFRSKPNDQVYDEHGRPLTDRSESSSGGMDIPRAKTLSVRTSSSGDPDARPTEYKMSGRYNATRQVQSVLSEVLTWTSHYRDQ